MGNFKKNFMIYVCLLLFGLISAIVLVQPHFLSIGNGWIPRFRCERLEFAASAFGESGKFDFSRLTHTLGYVLYFPILMQKFDIQSGRDMFCIAQSVSGGIIIFIYPLLMYKLFGSKILAVISPIMVQWTFGDLLYINKASEYWSGCWALALGLPLLVMFIKESKDKNRHVIVFCMALIMTTANIMRGQSGLPLLVVLLAVICKLLWEKKVKIQWACVYALLCIISFNLLGTTIPDAIAQRWGYDGIAEYNSSPWHSILIGMGYIDNDYGLYYNDDSAKNIIEKMNPNIVYNSDEYYDACKEYAIGIIKDNPGFVFEGLLCKFGECVRLLGGYFLGNSPLTFYYHPYVLLIIGLLINVIFLIKKKKIWIYVNEWGGKLIFCLLAVVLTLYPGVLVYPSEYYIWGALGGLGICLVLLLYSMIVFNAEIE